MVARGSTAFVGRVRELAELDRALDSAQSGAGATVLVSGEAGIGKSRLAAELTERARATGYEVLLGHSIDLVGTELPYQPFLEALRPIGELPQIESGAAGSQLHVFEETLALLGKRTSVTPVLLMLEDVHWADTSSLDLFLFLAHSVADHRLMLLATYRPDEPASTERMGRFATAVQRSDAALVLELGPLNRDEMRALIATRSDTALPVTLSETILARCEGNPLFAEELVAAAGGGDHSGELPRGLRDLLLRRVDQLDAATQSLLRLASAAGRDVSYGLLRTLAARPEEDVQASLREAVEHAVLVADLATGSFRFRHALLAEAIYSTILPGERETLHARLAAELSRSAAASPAELAPHWAAAGRNAEALGASVDAARQAAEVSGLPEAHAHLERAVSLWDAVPDAVELTGLDLAGLCAWAAEVALQVGAAPRALELDRRAIELVGDSDPHRASILHVSLGEDLYAIGNDEGGLAALERAVELAPADPPSPERAFALGSLAGGLMMAWRHSDSFSICEQALALAREIGAREAEVRALTVMGTDLTYLVKGEEGIPYFRQALELAQEIGDLIGLERAYTNFADALMVLGQLRESARLGREGLEVLGRYGVHNTMLITNYIEALVAIGDWDDADRLSAAALRAGPSDHEYFLLSIRASLEVGRGEFDAAREHLEAARVTLPEGLQGLDGYGPDLALWERRWTDADTIVQEGLAQASGQSAARLRVELCAKGLRAQAELAALARPRRDADSLRARLQRAQALLGTARRASAEASKITPTADGWLAVAEAEYLRTRAEARPAAWERAAMTWDRLERPPLAAYCWWRQAEALVETGASRTEASVPLREAHKVATRIGASPLIHELEQLAERARLDLTEPARPHDGESGPLDELGLTTREAEVLALVARGYTNREIAETLVISVKTASVHVTHILQKLNASNRREAAAIAHRLISPGAAQPSPLKQR